MNIIPLFLMSFLVFSKDLRVAIKSRPTRLIPFYSTDANSQNINRLLHWSLIDFDQDMKIKCRLCKFYDEKILNGKHYIRFRLKEDAKFWDESNVTSQDVGKSVKYYQDEMTIKSPFRFAFKKISKVNIISPSIVEFVYDYYDKENFSNLVLLKILKKKDENKDWSIENILGLGEFQFDQIEGDIILKDGNKRIIFKVVKDETTLAIKLLKNEIDLSPRSFSPRKVKYLEKKDHLKINSVLGTNYNYLGINHRNKYLAKKNIRKAISLLIPRKELIEHKFGNTVKASAGVLSPSFKKFDANLVVDEHNVNEAKKLIELEGPFEKPLSFELILTNNFLNIEMATFFKHYLSKGNIELKIRSYEWGVYYRRLKKGHFDLAYGSWIGITGPEILGSLFHSEKVPPKGPNRGFYKNKELDQLLDSMKVGTKLERRPQLYIKIQKLLKNDLPYIDLWHPNIIWISRKCVKNTQPYPNGSFLPLLEVKNECTI